MKNDLKVVIVADIVGIPAPESPLNAIPEITKELIESGVANVMISVPLVSSPGLFFWKNESVKKIQFRYLRIFS